jgi:hypothetical protein
MAGDQDSRRDDLSGSPWSFETRRPAASHDLMGARERPLVDPEVEPGLVPRRGECRDGCMIEVRLALVPSARKAFRLKPSVG